MTVNKKTIITLVVLIIITIGIISSCSSKIVSSKSKQEVVNVYSARHYDIDNVIYEAFEKKTGIKVNLVTGKAVELLESLERDGENTEADIFISADISNFKKAIDNGLTQPIDSRQIEKNVPIGLKCEDNQWIGLTVRPRAIVYNKGKVKKEELSTLEDLANEKWNGQILTRSSDSLYSKSLLGSYIELKGENEARKWAQGIVNNLAKQPEGNDKEQIKAIAQGQGSIAIVSAHYIGNMLNSQEASEKKAAQEVGVFIPKDSIPSVSGVVLSKYSKNKENAVKLIEFLLQEKAQKALTEINYEYPVNQKVVPNETLLSWGNIIMPDINLKKISDYNIKATEIFEEVGWK